jgi:hypothetical protein
MFQVYSTADLECLINILPEINIESTIYDLKKLTVHAFKK